MSAAACTAEPISQLRLERYELAELPASERDRIERHLAACAGCRHSLAQLRADRIALSPLPATLPQLNELPPAARRIVLPARASGPAATRARVRWALRVGAGLALAAGALLALRVLPDAARGPSGEHGAPAVKGGELAFELVRERAGDVARDPATFADGDRFAVLATCPPPAAPYWQLVVYQAGEAFFPLEPVEPLRCGNAVQLPGAFTLDGTAPARVCLVLSDAPLPRSALASSAPEALPAAHACKVISPAR